MPNYARYLRHRLRGRHLPRCVYYSLDAHRHRPLTVIDVGGFDGSFMTDLAAAFRIGRGLLIEPQPDRAAGIKLRFTSPEFVVAAVAVSDQPGECEIDVRSGAEATTSLLRLRTEMPELSQFRTAASSRVRVPVVTLDELTAKHGFEKIDLIKMDIQGNELRALVGGESTIQRTHFVFVEMSLQPLYDGSSVMHEVVDWLRRRGLLLIDLVPEFTSPCGELLQVNGLFARGGG